MVHPRHPDVHKGRNRNRAERKRPVGVIVYGAVAVKGNRVAVVGQVHVPEKAVLLIRLRSRILRYKRRVFVKILAIPRIPRNVPAYADLSVVNRVVPVQKPVVEDVGAPAVLVGPKLKILRVDLAQILCQQERPLPRKAAQHVLGVLHQKVLWKHRLLYQLRCEGVLYADVDPGSPAFLPPFRRPLFAVAKRFFHAVKGLPVDLIPAPVQQNDPVQVPDFLFRFRPAELLTLPRLLPSALNFPKRRNRQVEFFYIDLVQHVSASFSVLSL